MITVTLQDTAPEYPAEDFPIQVLYEDEAILAVDKPSGLIIHPSAARNTGTLANRCWAITGGPNRPVPFTL